LATDSQGHLLHYSLSHDINAKLVSSTPLCSLPLTSLSIQPQSGDAKAVVGGEDGNLYLTLLDGSITDTISTLTFSMISPHVLLIQSFLLMFY
jgi:hypothetical protein